MGSIALHSSRPPALRSNATSRALSLVGQLLLSYSATRQSLRAEYSREVAHHWRHLPPAAASAQAARERFSLRQHPNLHITDTPPILHMPGQCGSSMLLTTNRVSSHVMHLPLHASTA